MQPSNTLNCMYLQFVSDCLSNRIIAGVKSYSESGCSIKGILQSSTEPFRKTWRNACILHKYTQYHCPIVCVVPFALRGICNNYCTLISEICKPKVMHKLLCIFTHNTTLHATAWQCVTMCDSVWQCVTVCVTLCEVTDHHAQCTIHMYIHRD